MEIIDQDVPSTDWRPWEPPLWLIALGLSLALLIGFAVSGQVQDPRHAVEPQPTRCVPTAITQNAGASYVWSYCP